MNLKYPYRTKVQENGAVFVEFVDIEEAFTQADDAEQAAFFAAEVLSMMLEERISEGKAVPRPSEANGLPVAMPEAPIQAALQMRWAREAQGRTLADVARMLETSWPAAQRLERLGNPTLKQLERAAAVLGKRLVISLEDPKQCGFDEGLGLQLEPELIEGLKRTAASLDVDYPTMLRELLPLFVRDFESQETQEKADGIRSVVAQALAAGAQKAAA